MSALELKDLPDLPEDKADRIKKNWWVYLLVPTCSLLTYLITNYTENQRGKPCNDRVIYLLNKLDSTDKSNMEYMRVLIKSKDKSANDTANEHKAK